MPGSTRLNVVAYHPFPETVAPADGGDPLGFPAINGTKGGLDWMAGYYGAYYYPTVRFDGVLEEANRADFSSASYVDAYRAHVEARLASPAPVALEMNGSLGAPATLDVRIRTAANLSAQRLVLRVAIVEDEVEFAGANGVGLHRFVARQRFPDQPIAWETAPGGFGFAVRFTFTPAAAWRAHGLGAVAWVQQEGEGTRLAPREVAQSATFLYRQPEATVQVERAVLLEMYTATWCEACVFGDGAVETLLAEYGVPLTRVPPGWDYLRPPSPLAALLIAALAAPAAWFATRRWP